MPTTFLLYHRRAEASTTSNPRSDPGPPSLNPAGIALVSIFSALIAGIMIFCLYRFCPGLAWRQRRKAESQLTSPDVKHTFLNLDDEKIFTGNYYAPAPEVKQTFLYLDEDKTLSEKRALGIDMHPAMRSSDGRSKRKYGANRNESLDSTTSIAPLIKKTDIIPASPPQTYSPRIYSPQTPPPVPETSTEVRISPKCTRTLPTPVQPSWRSPQQPSRYDISPLQSSTTLPHLTQLPMSFLFEIDAMREDQTGLRSRTVSPLQNPQTPTPDRGRIESQLSSRNVSPISPPSLTPVITYPSATPVYLPRPFSKYNPYRPALEPAGSKNWPLENMPIPEHSVVKNPVQISPVRKHLTQSPLKPQGTISPTPSTITISPALEAPNEKSEKETCFTHPELDHTFLEDIHRRRRQQQQRAREEQQKQKRTAEREKGRRKSQATVDPATGSPSVLHPAKELSSAGASSKEKGIPPNRTALDPVLNTKMAGKREQQQGRDDGVETPTKVERRKSINKKATKGKRVAGGGLLGFGLPPRLPSKSRKLSQSPDAYEKARRISGLHELVGSSSS